MMLNGKLAMSQYGIHFFIDPTDRLIYRMLNRAIKSEHLTELS